MAAGHMQALLALMASFEARLSTVEESVGVPVVGVGAPAAAVPRGLPAAASAAADVPEFVSAFDEYCTTCLVPFVAACDTLGGGAAAGVS